MAQFGDDLGPSKGSVNEFTFYMRNGKKIMRQKHRRVSDKERTPGAMNHRTRWSNIVRAWQVLKTSLKGLFEHDQDGRTDYNWFMSLNVPHMQAYLTKEEADLGASVLEAFTVSNGSLQPAVQVAKEDEMLVSNLKMNGLSAIDEATTVSSFSIAFRGVEGTDYKVEELVFVCVTQVVDEPVDIPALRVRSWRLEPNTKDTRLLLNLLGLSDGSLGLLIHDGYLAARPPRNSMVAWVLKSRDERGRVLISPQNLEGDNELLSTYTSPEQRFEAVYSYGPVQQYSVLDPRSPITRDGKPRLAYDPDALDSTGPSKHRVAVTAQAFPEGSGTVAGGGRFAKGTAVSLLALPAQGFRFLSWTDGDTQPSRTLTANSDQALTAVFVPKE